VCDDARYFYCQQANFNAVALADSSGSAAEKIKYHPYGQYSFILDGSTGNTLLFQGQRYDAESGLYYFRNRYLSPVLGRFLQRDPKEYEGAWGCMSLRAVDRSLNKTLLDSGGYRRSVERSSLTTACTCPE